MPNRDHLTRLDAAYYRGQAYVHWVFNIQDRGTGWLSPEFHYKFREFLAHTAFRYALTCPIYCLMPDHMHLIWIGIDDRCDQLKAVKYFRKQVGEPLRAVGFEFQHQPYDHVLKDDERIESAFVEIVEYVARNPERKKILPVDGSREYQFTGCMVPGYPELNLWITDFWPRFWRTCSFLRKNGLVRECDEEITSLRSPG